MKKLAGTRNRSLLNALQNVLGGNTWRAILLVVGILLALDWLGSSLFLLTESTLTEWGVPYPPTTTPLLFLIIGLLIILYAIHFLRNQEAPADFAAEQREITLDPPDTRVLVLFLSALPKDHSLNDAASLPSRLDPATDLNQWQDTLANWRMPLEAIKPHLSAEPEKTRLKEIVVIPSGGDDGSVRDLDLFRQILTRLLAPHNIRILSLDDFKHSAPGTNVFDPQGCDFNEVESVWNHLQVIWETYRQQEEGWVRRLKERQILVDITAGTKLASVAGALFTREQDRRCQYVRISDGTPRVFTIDVLRTDRS
ncbi:MULTISPECIES: hypothetical protein [Thioalkalivibrio]|uniref:Uncharacterized protein n=1 Tax=Thioalkalivibrio halophilus TaxID=252474 RepID=A0A1V3A0F0_9GAMM|nr:MULTISPECIES: hypothetical protein [Thioalkalivibrio]OOC10830.1 hypothetical protein B1A74_03095 [Thioalkalivibrio halophilus]